MSAGTVPAGPKRPFGGRCAFLVATALATRGQEQTDEQQDRQEPYEAVDVHARQYGSGCRAD